MRITRISVGLDVTVNLGNYENVKPTAVFEAELDRDESPEQVEFQLRGKVQQALAAQLSEMLVERAQGGLAECKDLSTAITRTEASPLFKWIVQLDPDEADDVIAAVKSRWNILHAEPVYVPVDDERAPGGLFDDFGLTVDCKDLDITFEDVDPEVAAILNRYAVPVGAAADEPLGEDDFDDEEEDFDFVDDDVDYFGDDSDDEDDDDGGTEFDDDEPDADGGGTVSEREDVAAEAV